MKHEEGFDPGWAEESYDNLKDYLLLIERNLDPQQVLSAKNAEVRRYLMKKVGYDNVKHAVGAVTLHTDGTSELLRFADGDLYVKVRDSSSEREYLLYVPSNMKTCREAIAWTFGLREHEYAPEVET